jgi:voltage-gated potassium channel
MTFRERVYYLVEPGDDSGRFIDASILVLIILNVVALILETIPGMYAQAPRAFQVFEQFSLVIFAVEYAVRLWSCTAMPAYAGPVRGRLRFALRPLPLVDLVAILPLFMPLLGLDLRFVRVVRLFRLLRVLKLARYSSALRLLGRVVYGKRDELTSIFFVLIILLVLSSSLMYLAENGAQPEVFSSIPTTMWWSVITLTTVGYGDAYPVTAIGRLIASMIAILGIGMFALPAGLLGAGFVEELADRRDEAANPDRPQRRCPHCGELLDA